MATTPCRDCGNPVSNFANKCPKCGAKDPAMSTGARIFTALLVIGLFLSLVVYCGDIDVVQLATEIFDDTPTTRRTTTTRPPTTTTTTRGTVTYTDFATEIRPLLREMGGTVEEARQLAFEICDLTTIEGATPAAILQSLVEEAGDADEAILWGRFARISMEAYCPRELVGHEYLFPE